MATLRENRYGKTGVRLVKVSRNGATHDLREWTVRVLLEGEFTAVFTQGDNTDVLATDTMKNTVYSLAEKSTSSTMEAFAAELAAFFLDNNSRVSAAEVHIAQGSWKRLTIDGELHPHSFMKGSNELATATIRQTRETAALVCGLEDMTVLKTAQSAFTGFKRDALTTLKETEDRLLGTAVQGRWSYSGGVDAAIAHAAEYRRTVRESLLHTFAKHDSKSVQQTLYAMAENALEALPQLAEITLTMPNRHNILVDLSAFGQNNANAVFMPIDDPSGYIEARVTRS